MTTTLTFQRYISELQEVGCGRNETFSKFVSPEHVRSLLRMNTEQFGVSCSLERGDKHTKGHKWSLLLNSLLQTLFLQLWTPSFEFESRFSRLWEADQRVNSSNSPSMPRAIRATLDVKTVPFVWWWGPIFENKVYFWFLSFWVSLSLHFQES